MITKSTIAPLPRKVFERATEERCSLSFVKTPLFKFLYVKGSEKMENKVINITIKPKLFYKLMIFKIQFQFLFNPVIADRTMQRMIDDIGINIGKYIRVVQD